MHVCLLGFAIYSSFLFVLEIFKRDRLKFVVFFCLLGSCLGVRECEKWVLLFSSFGGRLSARLSIRMFRNGMT